MNLQFLFLIVFLTKNDLILSLEWKIQENFICVYDRTDDETQLVDCYIARKNWKTNLFCERNINDKNCGNNGCISASFELKDLSENRSKLDEISFVQYSVSIEKKAQEKSKRIIQNVLNGSSTYNVTLHSDLDVKGAVLKVKSISYFYEYKICVDPFFNTSIKDPEYLEFEYLKEFLCCIILLEEPEKEIITFHLEIIIIACLLIFYVAVILMAWKRKDTHQDKHLIRKKSIAKKVQSLKVKNPLENIEVVVQNGNITEKGIQDSKSSTEKIQEEIQKHLRRKSDQYNINLFYVRKMSTIMPNIDSDDDGFVEETFSQDMSLNERSTTGYYSQDRKLSRSSQIESEKIQEDVQRRKSELNKVVPKFNQNALYARKKSNRLPNIESDDEEKENDNDRLKERRPTGKALKDRKTSSTNLKIIQNEVHQNLRRKSNQFSRNLFYVRKMSNRLPNIVNDEEDTNDTEFTVNEEGIKQSELQIGRKSFLRESDFFKDIPKGKASKYDIFDAAEEAARRAFANRNRECSAAYAVQKAKSLNVSDDSD